MGSRSDGVWHLLCIPVSPLSQGFYFSVAQCLMVVAASPLVCRLAISYNSSLERVPETGRLRFIDVSPEKEEAMGLRTQQETLAQFQGQLLPASNPTSRRVREIARRIVEGNGLGHMKDDHSWTNLPDIKLSQIWGGGEQPEEPMMGDGYDPRRSLGSSTNKRDVEWEVYVIKDDSVKNAFVLPGTVPFLFLVSRLHSMHNFI